MKRAVLLLTVLVGTVFGAGVIAQQTGESVRTLPGEQPRMRVEAPGQAQPSAPAVRPAPPSRKQASVRAQSEDATCIECHKKTTPLLVSDWESSTHSRMDVGCTICHGGKHTTKDDAAEAELALPEKCAACHEEKVRQFKDGKHALGWASMKAMPTIHWQPMAQIEGQKGCGGCHRIGLKTDAEVKELVKNGSAFGASSCDACHTRHLFSADEARQPQACRTCHMGIDHPQWEMYSSSKHGARYDLVQKQILPEDVAAPTCQTCHMQEGNHGVRTAWGFLGVRLPMPEDKAWAANRTTVLQGLGVLDPDGKPTTRLEAVKAADLARLTQESWQAERDKMLKTCNQCHSLNFATAELEKSDRMIQEADRLMSEGILTVAGLYRDGVIKKPQSYAHAFPDLLTFHDAPTVVEQKLFIMFLEHRMRTFQGAFHANPDYSLWYGWSAMQRDLTEIKELAATMREKAKPVEARQAPAAAEKEPVKPVKKK